LAHVDVKSNTITPDLVFRLNRGARFPLRIVDENGTGIAGAFAVVALPVAHNAEFPVTTDANGRACFYGIPTNALNGLTFHAGAKGYYYSRDVAVSSTDADPTIRLVKALRVSGNVLDADTRQPVKAFKMMPCTGESSAGYDRSATKPGQLGLYSMDFSEPGAPYRVRIEAEGYEPAMSEPMMDHPSEQTQDFLLHRIDTNRVIRGIVLKPDGEPASGVAVCLLTFEQGATVYHGTFRHGDGAVLATTDAQGNFRFIPDPQAHTLAAADPVAGFGLLRIHRSAQPYKVQLEPWGRIEGRVTKSGSITGGQRLTVARGGMGYHSAQDGLALASDWINTDNEGRFVCELLAPGEVTLYLYQGRDKSASSKAVTEIRTGETTQIEMGGRRLVVGKLKMSDRDDVDWASQVVTASLASNYPRPAGEPPPDLQSLEERLRVLDFFDQSEEWRAYESNMGCFSFQVDADGSFAVENVPPGPYLIRVTVSDSPYTGTDPIARHRRRIVASLKQEVVVPDAVNDSAPVSIGTFRLQASPSLEDRTGKQLNNEN
jgi:hypothetical protein